MAGIVPSDARVCVLGAGIAGLVTAKVLSEDGFDVIVLERDSALGGTWAPSRAYPGLRANNSKRTYEFSDLSYPDSVAEFPSAEEVRAYLESYAHKFDIASRIHLKKEVMKVSRSGDSGGLTLRLRSTTPEHEETSLQCDYLAVCNGVFHQPVIPEISGSEGFAGRILHSSQVNDQTYRTGDRVVVIGAGKSAFDCAAWAAQKGLIPTLIYRRPQWMAPRYLPGGRIPGDYLVTSRFLSAFLRYHRPSSVQRLMQSIGTPVVRLWWALIAAGWTKDLGIPQQLKPPDRLPAGLEKVGVGDDFYVAINSGDARALPGSLTRFRQNEVELDDGTLVSADVVIFATGWRQDLSFLSEDIRAAIEAEGYHRLFRQILPPAIRNIGFVGYASSFACTVTSEIAAHWLSEAFMGTLQLPTAEVMQVQIDKVHGWAEEYLPNRGTEGFIGPFISQYTDELLEDLGMRTRRRHGFLGEHFKAFTAARFAGLAEERRAARSAPT